MNIIVLIDILRILQITYLRTNWIYTIVIIKEEMGSCVVDSTMGGQGFGGFNGFGGMPVSINYGNNS